MSDKLTLDDTACSFAEWKAAGYFVKKGSKSQMRDALGVPQFTADQVVRSGYGRTKTHWETLQSAGKKPQYAGPSEYTPRRTPWEAAEAKARAKGTPWGVVEDFDSFVREAGMLPGRSVRFAVSDPLEMHFMNVADKHGILDHIIDGYEDDYY